MRAALLLHEQSRSHRPLACRLAPCRTKASKRAGATFLAQPCSRACWRPAARRWRCVRPRRRQGCRARSSPKAASSSAGDSSLPSRRMSRRSRGRAAFCSTTRAAAPTSAASLRSSRVRRAFCSLVLAAFGAARRTQLFLGYPRSCAGTGRAAYVSALAAAVSGTLEGHHRQDVGHDAGEGRPGPPRGERLEQLRATPGGATIDLVGRQIRRC